MNIFADMASTPPTPTTERATDTPPIHTKRSAAEYFKCLISEY